MAPNIVGFVVVRAALLNAQRNGEVSVPRTYKWCVCLFFFAGSERSDAPEVNGPESVLITMTERSRFVFEHG